jgi:hypothetical protein
VSRTAPAWLLMVMSDSQSRSGLRPSQPSAGSSCCCRSWRTLHFREWTATGGPLCNVRTVGDVVSDPLTQGWHVANGATLWIAPLS